MGLITAPSPLKFSRESGLQHLDPYLLYPIVVHASPCSGKTTLMKSLANANITALDTDEVLDERHPNWKETWSVVRDHDPKRLTNVAREWDAICDNVAVVANRFLETTDAGILLSNMRERAFLARILRTPLITVFTEPKIIHTRSIERGGRVIEESTATEWFNGWLLDPSLPLNKIILRDEGPLRYLSDLFTIRV